MEYEVKVVTSIDDLDHAEWDRLNAEFPFGSSRWIRIAARVSNDLQPFFLLVYDGNKLVGTATASLTRQTGVPISSVVGRRLVTSMLQRYPLLLCRSLFGGESGLRLPTGDEVSALRAITGTLRRMAQAKQASFVVLGWLTHAEQNLVKRAGGFECVSMDSSMSLPLVWTSFEQFVAALGNSMQKDLRRHQNRARELGIIVERSNHFTQHTDRLYELIENVERHHGNVGEKPYSNEMLTIIERDLPDKSVMLLARVGTTLVGCGLLLHDNGALALTLLGLDYRFKYVYFQLFYETIRYAIDKGLQIIYGGSGAYDFKRRLGFREQSTFAAFNSHMPVLQWLGRQLARTISGRTEQLTVS